MTIGAAEEPRHLTIRVPRVPAHPDGPAPLASARPKSS